MNSNSLLNYISIGILWIGIAITVVCELQYKL